MEKKQRIFGLDVMRIVALMLVLTAQCIWILPQAPAVFSQLASLFHFIGLEIFFVLCGFLLFGNLFSIFLDGKLNSRYVSFFIKKRALEILPLYYLVLGISFMIALLLHYPLHGTWKYFVLLQNFAWPMPAFFPESWGLPVLFFSCLLLPVLLLILKGIFRNHKSTVFMAAIVLMILFSMILRWIYNATTTNSGIEQWDRSLKSVIIYRLDSVFIGVLFGWLGARWPVFFSKAKWLWAFAGFIGIVFIFFGVGYFQLFIESHKLFWNVFYLPLTSLSIAFFLPLLSQWEYPYSFIKNSVALLAKSTFAIYLFHFSVVLPLVGYIFPHNWDKTILFIILYLTMSFGTGIFVWYFYQNRIARLISRQNL